MKSNKQSLPDKNGFFGDYGGKFVPETLMYALEQLESTYNNFCLLYTSDAADE